MDKTSNLEWCIMKALQEEIGMNVKEKFEKIITTIEDLVLNDLKKASDISEQIATNMYFFIAFIPPSLKYLLKNYTTWT